MSLYNLLRNKEIIAILVGDVNFGEYNSKKIVMPYLSGNKLCSIAAFFGFYISNTSSRWIYLESIIEHCIKNDTISQLLAYLFDKDKFVDVLSGLSRNEIDETYKHIVGKVLEQINSKLYFGGNELVVNNKQFIIKPLNATVSIDAPNIKVIDREYIKDLAERASDDINKSNFDSAITKCRTLVEEVFCYVIEQKNEAPSNKGDISILYTQVKTLYNMHQIKEFDNRINMLLSGLEKILKAISEMRNNNSDAHGMGMRRINIEEHHARLVLNSATALSDFILAVANKNKAATKEK